MLRFAAAVAPTAIRLLGATSRTEIVDGHHLKSLQSADGPFLFCLWHGRILLPIYRHRNAGHVAMVSLSADGDPTARVLESLGYGTVRGSSTRGGREAFHALADVVRGGTCGAIIPDGPRGPARQMKPGILYLAQLTGVPILPVSASARPARLLGSWDRFLLPAPFARAVIVYGEPLRVPERCAESDLEGYRQELEDRMNQIEREADARMGR